MSKIDLILESQPSVGVNLQDGLSLEITPPQTINIELTTQPIGSDGKSAYQIAVDNGFSGTQSEWLASIGSSRFEHNQSVANSTWVVNHNLGSRPNVCLLSTGGLEMMAEIIHISVNQVQVFFDSPVAGLAICS